MLIFLVLPTDALLGQRCDASTLCRAPMSRCDGKSCNCPSSFIAASDNLCKVIATSILGEPCNPTTPCSNNYELECRDETCQCRSGGHVQLRPATDKERLAQPTLVLQCRPLGFSLGKLNTKTMEA